MPTTKPKIQGYISEWLASQFEAERERWDLSQSLALERVLFERYGGTQAEATTTLSSDLRLSALESTLELLLQRISNLEQIQEITGNLDGDTEITSDIAGNLPEEIQEITGNLDGDTEITSDIAGNLPEEIQEITSNLGGDTHAFTPLGTPVTFAPEVLSQIVICQFHEDTPRYFKYWAGKDRGFTGSLSLAKRYKSEKTASKQASQISQDPDYHNSEAGWVIKYNAIAFFLEAANKQ